MLQPLTMINKKNDLSIIIVNDYGAPSGYSRAAKDYVFALDKAGAYVIPYFPPSTWNGKDIDQDDLNRLKELSQRKPTPNAVFIEMMVPELMSNDNNIAYCVWETTHAPRHWAEKLNLKKAVLTCSPFSRDALVRCGVKVPIYIIPHTIRMPEYDRYMELDGIKKCNFLTVGEFSERKNIEETIYAFLMACNGLTDVSLTAKVSSFNPTKTGMKIKQMVERVHTRAQEALKDAYNPPKVLLCDKIVEDGYMPHFYANSSYYITASFGEAFNLPLAEAMYYGLTCIAPKEGGHSLYFNEQSGIAIEGDWVKAGGVEGNNRYDNAGAWYKVPTESIIEAIKTALSADTTKEALIGQKIVRENLNEQKVAELFLHIMSELSNPIITLHAPQQLPKPREGRPYVVKCVQALNEQQLIKPVLRNLYDNVDLTLIVEGGAEGRHDVLNGHSIDGTNQQIVEFLNTEDKDHKCFLFTKAKGFRDYEDIKNVFALFINNELKHIKDKVCFIQDADEFMTPEGFENCIQEFIKHPDISEVVPKFLHFWQYINVIERPIPSKMNIQHQRMTRWPVNGGFFYNHPTLTDLGNGCDTACHPSYQTKRIVVDEYIYHVGGMKSLDFYTKKHEYYEKTLKGHLNPDRKWHSAGEMPVDRMMTYTDKYPKEILELKYPVMCESKFPDWMSSNAYNCKVKTIPLFTAMSDSEFVV